MSTLLGAFQFAALFYISSSYFYVDIFTRDALNECAIFIFVPLIFLSFYYLFKERNRKLFSVFFIIGYIGMIYSHLVMTVFFTMLIMLFLLLYIKDIFKKKNFITLIISTLIVLIFTSSFTVPLIEHMINNSWNLPFKSNWVIPITGYLIPDYYLSSEKGLIYVCLFTPVVILCIIALYNLYINKKDENRKFIFGLALFTIITLVYSGFDIFWKNAPDFFKTLQFAWRLAVYSVFGTSFLSIYGLDKFFGFFKKKYIHICSIVLIIMIFVFTCIHHYHTNFYRDINYNDLTVNSIFITDYLPLNSMDNIKYINARDSNIIIGSSNVNIIKNDTPYMKFELTNAKEEVKLQLPRLYYLGYTLTDSDGNKMDYREDEYGLIVTNVKEGIYELKYTGTFFYKTALIAKSLLIIGILIYGVIERKNRNFIKKLYVFK